MSGADDLRTALRDGIGRATFMGGTYENAADFVLAFIADPVRRLAILNLIGDAREGWAEDWHDAPGTDGRRDWIVNSWANEPRLSDDGTPMTRVLVVRPRSEPA